MGASTVEREWIQTPKILDFDPLWPLRPGCPVSGPFLTGCHLTSSAAPLSPLFGNIIPNNFWPRNVEIWPDERDRPDGYYRKWADWLCLNHSRCPTNCRSGMIDPSQESCDSPLQEEPTLPSLGLRTVKGTPLQLGQTLDFSPSREFSPTPGPS